MSALRLRPLLSANRGPLAVLAGVSAVGAVLEATALLSLVPLASTVASRSRTFTAHLLQHEWTLSVTQLIALCGVLIVARGFVQALGAYLQATLVSSYEAKRRSELFSAFIHASWDCQSRERGGQLLDLLATFVPYSRQALDSLCGSLVSIFSLVMLISAAVVVNAPGAGTLLITMIVLFFTIRPISRLAQRVHTIQARLDQEYAHAVNEAFTLAREIRIMQAAASIQRRTDALVERSASNRRRQLFLSTLTSTLYMNIALLIIVAGLAVIHILGAQGLPALSAMVLLLFRGLSYSQSFQALYHRFVEVSPYDEALDARIAEFNAHRDVAGSGRDIEPVATVELRNVSYSYVSGVPVISDLSFVARRGEVIGIVGPSGAGKSTLVQLLLGLRQPTSGQILLDGIALNDVESGNWLTRIGFVPQEPLLLNDTVETNIKFFRSDLNNNDVRAAAAAAYIHDEILSWPAGYNTIVGERGTAISGGQRQRICIARALAKGPDVLVFDEPTSALDPRNEHMVQRTIQELRNRAIIFIVAHRPTTLAICDSIMVIDAGRLQDDDSSDLAAQKTDYLKEMHSLSRSERWDR